MKHKGPEFVDFPYEKLNSSFCGPRALQIVYHYHFGRSPSQAEIAREMGMTEEAGTYIRQLKENLDKHNLGFIEIRDATWHVLTDFTNDPKYAVIVDYWRNDNQEEKDADFGHYDVAEAVVNQPHGKIHLVGEGWMTRSEFEKRWHDVEVEEDGTERRVDRWMIATFRKRVDIFD